MKHAHCQTGHSPSLGQLDRPPLAGGQLHSGRIMITITNSGGRPVSLRIFSGEDRQA